jgi:hypothetical protein
MTRELERSILVRIYRDEADIRAILDNMRLTYGDTNTGIKIAVRQWRSDHDEVPSTEPADGAVK